MPRGAKRGDGEGANGGQGTAVAAATTPLPPRTLNGAANPAYYLAKYRILNDRNEDHYKVKGEYPKGIESAVRSLERECQLAGIDPKKLHDTRTPLEKAADFVDKLVDFPGSAFEATEAEFDAIAGAMDTGDQFVRDEIDKRLRKAEEEGRPDSAAPKALPAGEPSSNDSESSDSEPPNETLDSE